MQVISWPLSVRSKNQRIRASFLCGNFPAQKGSEWEYRQNHAGDDDDGRGYAKKIAEYSINPGGNRSGSNCARVENGKGLLTFFTADEFRYAAIEN